MSEQLIRCSHCKQYLSPDKFNRSKSYKTGYTNQCKQCIKQRHIDHPEYRQQSRIRRAEKIKQYEIDNAERISIRKARTYAELKRKAYEILGNKCVCCGEIEPSFLEIDHVNNDGKQHRNGKHISKKLYKEIIENRCDVELQLLCGNCHNSKTRLGQCIHKLNK